MFGWLDKLWAAIFRRGRGLVEADDRVAVEKRDALRTVRDALRDAMVNAEEDRERGVDKARTASLVAAGLASTTVHEVEDEEARTLVAEWRRQFDAIPKGWKNPGLYTGSKPLGYPEPAWSELRAASDAAQDRIGELLRQLMT